MPRENFAVVESGGHTRLPGEHLQRESEKSERVGERHTYTQEDRPRARTKGCSVGAHHRAH